MSKHTAGPWKIELGFGGVSILTENETEITGPSGMKRGVVVALMGGAKGKKANAHLIAAAPELLEALEEYLAIFEDGLAAIELTMNRPEDMDRWDKSADKIAAAITKAKGE